MYKAWEGERLFNRLKRCRMYTSQNNKTMTKIDSKKEGGTVRNGRQGNMKMPKTARGFL
jgi:hypothetical protein